MPPSRVEIDVSDGTKMSAYVARPEGQGPFPGLVVIQEIFGVNAHIRSVTDRFAAEGFVAVAPELFHRTAPGFEGTYDNYEPGMKERQKMTPAGIVADLKAVYAWLQSDAGTKANHIGSVGFCLGGNLSFGMNTLLPLQAAVSYYGGAIVDTWLQDVDKMHAPLLMYWGLLDKHIGIEAPRQIADALRNAKKKFTSVEFSFAGHGFNCDARSDYNAEAAREAWAMTIAFLKLHLS